MNRIKTALCFTALLLGFSFVAQGQDARDSLLRQANETARMRQDSIVRLHRMLNQRDKEIASLKKTNASLEQEIGKLKTQVSSLEKVKNQWLDFFAVTVEERWKDKSFSQVDIAALRADVLECKDYASEDSRIAAAETRLSRLLRQAETYARCKKAVEEPYDKSIISQLQPLAVNLVKDAVGETEQKEMQALTLQLKVYGTKVRVFKGLIERVDKKVAEWDDHRSAWPMVSILLQDVEKEDGTISSIRSIPWLSQQYDAYLAALKKNCKGKNPARETIMGIAL